MMISTIILIAVSASLSAFIAFWGMGSIHRYQDPEKLIIVDAKCIYSSDIWKITLVVENKGNSDVVIKKVAINDLEVNIYRSPEPDQGQATTDAPYGLKIVSGETSVLHIYIDGPEGKSRYSSLSTGTTINIILLSSSGMEYRAPIELT